MPSGRDLYIPQYYEVSHQPFLEPPWKEFYAGPRYYTNLSLNIVAFVPFGFFLSAYFAMGLRIRRTVLISVIMGLTASLTIEILQAYIPTRNSEMTDLITNTLGTGIGASLYVYTRMQNFLACGSLGLRILGYGRKNEAMRAGHEPCNRDPHLSN